MRSADWKPEELATLPDDAWAPTDEDVRRRLDIEEVGEAVCSVDPPKARDIDDALHAIELERGADGKRYQVDVIADVCHFIHPVRRSTRAASAARPFTSWTSVSTAADILGENVGRCTPVRIASRSPVLWEIDEDANIISSSIAKTIIRSRAALEYREAQHRIDAAAGPPRRARSATPSPARFPSCTRSLSCASGAPPAARCASRLRRSSSTWTRSRL